jgi:hypothetical protein
MDNRLEDKEGELIEIKFGLQDSPLMVQLTKHVNNLLITQATNKSAVLDCFKTKINNPELEGFNSRVNQIVDYYGVNACKDWFKLIYDWKFEEVA